jgi:hypothetical protein
MTVMRPFLKFLEKQIWPQFMEKVNASGHLPVETTQAKKKLRIESANANTFFVTHGKKKKNANYWPGQINNIIDIC